MKYTVNKLLHFAGLTLTEEKRPVEPDMDVHFRSIYNNTRAYTMTSVERMYALYEAVKYISKAHIDGDVVECGVWRGGSMMICAYALASLHDLKRRIYLYDTYAGMPRPGKIDRTVRDNSSAHSVWLDHENRGKNTWCYADLNDVKKNLEQTKYPKSKLVFIKGLVEKTIPKFIPEKIALLRIDTDWYKSTYHELKHLFPRLAIGGVLIVDDYGHWKGARRAVDKYFKDNSIPMLLSRIDSSGRIGIKIEGKHPYVLRTKQKIDNEKHV